MEEQLKERDLKLLGFCEGSHRTIAQISKFLNIAVKNVYNKVYVLEKKGLVEIRENRLLKKKIVKTKNETKKKKYFIEILEKLKNSNNGLSKNEFFNLLPLDDLDVNKVQIPLSLSFSSLVEQRFFITPEGNEFLKEHRKI
jgi:hypothetical protein